MARAMCSLVPIYQATPTLIDAHTSIGADLGMLVCPREAHHCAHFLHMLSAASDCRLDAWHPNARHLSSAECHLQALVDQSGQPLHEPALSALGGCLSYLQSLLLDK